MQVGGLHFYYGIDTIRTRFTLTLLEDRLDNIVGDPNNASDALNAEQQKVLDIISFNKGSGATYIRDKAKRMGVVMPLGIIKELTEMGLVENTRDNNNVSTLTRIR